MSRRNRFRRPQDPAGGPPQEGVTQGEAPAGEQPQSEAAPPQADASVIILRLGGRNPLKRHNAYLIRGSRHALVDPGPPGTAGELLEQLSRHRISLGDIGLIVLTHGHPDHFGSAAQLKEWTRAPLAVHELDAEYVSFGSIPVLKPVTRLGSLFKSLFAMKSDPVEPDIMLHDGDKLGRYAGRGRVIVTPGHTAGSISILLPDGMCVVGDLVMRGLSARSPSMPWFAENVSEVRESLQRVVNEGAKTLLVGHGGPFKVADLKRSFPWLHVPEADAREESARDEQADEDENEGEAPEQSDASTQEAPERRRRRRPRRRRPQGSSGQPPSQNTQGTGGSES
jgi:hydroxyacylglutathione hydrolase